MRYAWNFPDGVNNGVCLLLFVGLCCPFQFYATCLAFLPLLEADFLGLYLGQSAVILEFQGHPLALAPFNQSGFLTFSGCFWQTCCV
jgi:hypothetical protein